MTAAGARWATFLTAAPGASVSVQIDFTPGSSVGPAPVTSVPFGAVGGVRRYQVEPASELRTGVDPNGAAPAISITVGPKFTADGLWFDPDPYARTAPVQADGFDAMTVLMHELGHEFGLFGSLDHFTGRLSGDSESTFVRWVTVDSATGTPSFAGPHASALYGGRVPPTYNYLYHVYLYHVGNSPLRAGQDLANNLMSGVGCGGGCRNDISALDLAITEDTGLALRANAVPEPRTGALAAVWPVAAWGVRRRASCGVCDENATTPGRSAAFAPTIACLGGRQRHCCAMRGWISGTCSIQAPPPTASREARERRRDVQRARTAGRVRHRDRLLKPLRRVLLARAGSPAHGAISPQSEMVPTAATHGWPSSCAPSVTPVMAGTFAPDEPQAAPTR